MVIGPAYGGLLHDLTDAVAPEFNFLDMFKTVRDWDMTYLVNGTKRILFVPVDSDFNALNLVYPEKLANTPHMGYMPQTWEQLLSVAERYDGAFNVTVDGVVKPVRGFCTYCGSAGTSLGLFTVLAPILQTTGTAQGTFFEPLTFATVFKTEAFAYGAGLWKRLVKMSDTLHGNGCARHFNYNGECPSLPSPQRLVNSP
eukprot:7386397-Prymnesium_polylepis.2